MRSNPQHITNLQLELVKLFRHDLPEEQLIEIRQLLSDYFAEKATEEMEKVWVAKKWTAKKMKELSKKHLRTHTK